MKYRILSALLVLLLASCGNDEPAKQETAKAPAKQKSKGEQIFNNNCIQCHSLTEDRMGPKLQGAFARWDNDTARISAFIRNAREAVHAGDPRAVQVAKEWNNAAMTPMPHLTDADIHALLEYLSQ